MENGLLLQYVLPKELFEYFDLVSIDEARSDELNLYLDEKKVAPSEHHGKPLVAYGFDEAKKIRDFPLRKRASI
ncbi:MAG: hypothetical protein RBR30_07285 [Tenuifilaceae bacterium]|nr:hypothetical protein [Tenuifilaceae bacterium]